ncbi:MAG: tetratricopeptide repeat protein, partial [Pedobacter sp.]
MFSSALQYYSYTWEDRYPKRDEDHFNKPLMNVKNALNRGLLAKGVYLLESIELQKMNEESRRLLTSSFEDYYWGLVADCISKEARNINSLQLYLNLCEMYYNARQFSKMINILESALKLSYLQKGQTAILYNNLATCYQHLNEPLQAISFYKESLKVKGNARVFNNLGLVYLEGGKHQLAIMAFSKSLEIDPFSSRSYYNRALSFLQTGLENEANNDLLNVLSSGSERSKMRKMSQDASMIGKTMDPTQEIGPSSTFLNNYSFEDRFDYLFALDPLLFRYHKMTAQMLYELFQSYQLLGTGVISGRWQNLMSTRTRYLTRLLKQTSDVGSIVCTGNPFIKGLLGIFKKVVGCINERRHQKKLEVKKAQVNKILYNYLKSRPNDIEINCHIASFRITLATKKEIYDYCGYQSLEALASKKLFKCWKQQIKDIMKNFGLSFKDDLVEQLAIFNVLGIFNCLDISLEEESQYNEECKTLPELIFALRAKFQSCLYLQHFKDIFDESISLRNYFRSCGRSTPD